MLFGKPSSSGKNHSVTGGSHRGEPAVKVAEKIEKPQLSGFSDGRSLASQAFPAEASLRDLVRPAAVGPFGTELCAPDLSRRTRICEPRASLAAYLVAVDMPFTFFIVINELAFG